MTMDLAKLKAPFPKDRVSWRAQTLTKDGGKAMALAYIDARDVMERLDEVCGPENWQKRYSHADKKTVCEIGIKVGGEWVWKADGAGDSDIEAEKGALSDAFKRAAVSWGIGRYLYDLDTPWVPCESKEFNGKKQFVKFTDDPWNHVKGAKAPPTESEHPAELPLDQRAKAWVEKAKDHVAKMPSRIELVAWQKRPETVKAMEAIKRDFPDMHEQFLITLDDVFNTLPAGKAA